MKRLKANVYDFQCADIVNREGLKTNKKMMYCRF